MACVHRRVLGHEAGRRGRVLGLASTGSIDDDDANATMRLSGCDRPRDRSANHCLKKGSNDSHLLGDLHAREARGTAGREILTCHRVGSCAADPEDRGGLLDREEIWGRSSQVGSPLGCFINVPTDNHTKRVSATPWWSLRP